MFSVLILHLKHLLLLFSLARPRLSLRLSYCLLCFELGLRSADWFVVFSSYSSTCLLFTFRNFILKLHFHFLDKSECVMCQEPDGRPPLHHPTRRRRLSRVPDRRHRPLRQRQWRHRMVRRPRIPHPHHSGRLRQPNLPTRGSAFTEESLDSY